MSAMSNFSQFNTNPACKDAQGPTDFGGLVERQITLAVYVLVAIFIVVTTGWYMYVRNFRRRIRIRSLNPIFMGSLGSAVVIVVRATYNYLGREHVPCALSLILVYLFFILNAVPDNLLVASFLVKQGFRAKFSSASLYGGGADVKDDTSSVVSARDANKMSSRLTSSVKRSVVNEAIVAYDSEVRKSSAMNESVSTDRVRSCATPWQWLKGFWNHFLTICESTSINTGIVELRFHAKWRFKEDLFVSSMRELSYDMVTSILFSGILLFAYIVRVRVTPVYLWHEGCTGCALFWEDLAILLTCLLFLCYLQILVLFRTRKVQDPLGYRRDLFISTALTLVAWVGYILASADPGGLMRAQQVDWVLIFESLAALLLHWRRCVSQIRRVSRIHKRFQNQEMKLIDILHGDDPRVAIMFERYLMGELASENLLFWREGTKYKMHFDKDLEYSQQVGRVLFRTFISKYAQLPINISGQLRNTIENRFRSGYIGRNVFDEALVEIYLMMQNGAFERFIQTEAFLQYANSNKADFSLSPSSASQIISSVDLANKHLSLASSVSTDGGTTAMMHEHLVAHHPAGQAAHSMGAVGRSNNGKVKTFNVGDYVRSLS